jgi:murein L,D-transpeptidase YcbB/YkuD
MCVRRPLLGLMLLAFSTQAFTLSLSHSPLSDPTVRQSGNVGSPHSISITGTKSQLKPKSKGINTARTVPLSKKQFQTSDRTTYLYWLSAKYVWDPIILTRMLRFGDRNSAVDEINARLILLGDNKAPVPTAGLFTANLATAVQRFQHRHGLDADGIVGPETLKWLNVTPNNKAQLLSQNMTSKIDYLANLGPRYLLVNIPAYELLLSDNGKVKLRSRVIVGKPLKPTPIMNSEISSIVINPSWRVPRSILLDDLLPKLQTNGAFIAEQNFSVFDMKNERVEKKPEEWSKLAKGDFPYRLEQKPGVSNTLGRYKLYFPNKYSVFLHDTPNPELFNNTNRSLSSGCVRIEKVEALASWIANNLIQDKQLWTELLAVRTNTKWFTLRDILPIHLVYWTAWIDDMGLSQFRDDIYALQPEQ